VDHVDELGTKVEEINAGHSAETEPIKPSMLRESGCLTNEDMKEIGLYLINKSGKPTMKEITTFINDLIKQRMARWHVLSPRTPASTQQQVCLPNPYLRLHVFVVPGTRRWCNSW